MCNRQYSADFVSSFSFKSDSSPKNDPLLLLNILSVGHANPAYHVNVILKQKSHSYISYTLFSYIFREIVERRDFLAKEF